MAQKQMRRRLNVGSFVFGSLAGIKVVEYLIATGIKSGDWPYLAVLAVVSAGLIIYFYMHFHQLWSSGGGDDE